MGNLKDAEARRAAYRELCEREALHPFARAWYIEAQMGEKGWDAALLYKGDVLCAALPYGVKSRYGFRYAISPPLSQVLYPWLRPEAECGISREELLLGLLGELQHRGLWYVRLALPKDQAMCAALTQLRFGYYDRISLRIPPLAKEDEVIRRISPVKSRAWRKAKKGEYKVEFSEDADLFLRLYQGNLTLRGVDFQLPLQMVEGMLRSSLSHGVGEVATIYSPAGEPLISHLLIRSHEAAYYMAGSFNPSADPALTSMLFGVSITHVGAQGLAYDFEGGMHPKIGDTYGRFGSEAYGYYVAHWVSGRFWPIRNLLQQRVMELGRIPQLQLPQVRSGRLSGAMGPQGEDEARHAYVAMCNEGLPIPPHLFPKALNRLYGEARWGVQWHRTLDGELALLLYGTPQAGVAELHIQGLLFSRSDESFRLSALLALLESLHASGRRLRGELQLVDEAKLLVRHLYWAGYIAATHYDANGIPYLRVW